MPRKKKLETFEFVDEIIGYTRVSTREQSMKGYSIDEQKEMIKSFAKKRNLQIEDRNILEDPGFSAGSLKRPNLQRLFEALSQRKGVIKKIIVFNSSRLTRDPLNKYTLKCIFEKYNIDILCIEGRWVAESPAEEVGTEIQVYLDSHQRKRVGPDTIKGLTGSAKQGNYSTGGTVPRGYKRQPNEKLGKGSFLVPVEEQRQYIEYIFTSIKDRKHTLSSIARLYSKNKVMDLKWNENCVRALVENHIYYGRYKTGYCDIENHTIPIITKNLYDDCHASMKIGTRIPKHFYVYGGLVYCTHCHQFCIKESAYKKKRDGTKKLYRYYRCSSCKKRMNENNIDKTVSMSIDHHALPAEKFDLIVELSSKKKQIIKRITIYENSFDNLLMDEKEFKTKFHDAKIKIMKIEKEIKKIEDTTINSFKSLSELEKRKLAGEKIKRINIDFLNSECTVILDDNKKDS